MKSLCLIALMTLSVALATGPTVAEECIRHQVFELVQVADIDLQRHLHAVVVDGDLGDVGGGLGPGEDLDLPAVATSNTASCTLSTPPCG